MTILNVSNLKKMFGTDIIFNNVSFNIEHNDKIGLVGVNGAGKTTLFKVLMQMITPDDGEVFKNKLTKIGYLQQHAYLNSSKSIWDEVISVYDDVIQIEKDLLTVAHDIQNNIGNRDTLVEKQHNLSEQFENRNGFTYKSLVRGALLGLGFKEDEFNMPFTSLSGGQKTRILLCKILLSDCNLLLLDEPTNHLDINSVEWLEGFIKNYSGAVIVISHDRYFLDRVTNKTFELQNNNLRIYNGNYSTYLNLKSEQEKAMQKQYDTTSREINRIEGIIKQQRQWNREKNIKTAESKQKVIDRLEKTLEKPQASPESIKFKFSTNASGGNDVLMCEDLSMSFGQKHVFKNINMFIYKSQKVFLLGDNGCGKTTLLKIIMGELKALSGTYKIGANISIGYYDQTQSSLDHDKTAFDEVFDAYPKMTQTDIRNALATFLFKDDDVFKTIKTLSGGEKARIALLKLMLSDANVLFLDEPTNHLDIESREALENTLLSYEGTLLIVSHDRYFINKIADKILYMTKDGLKEYIGDYNYFLEKHKEIITEKAIITENKNDYKQRKEEDAAKRKLANQIKNCEEKIAKAEEEIESLKEQLLSPQCSTDYIKAMEITKRIEEVDVILENLYNEWEGLNI